MQSLLQLFGCCFALLLISGCGSKAEDLMNERIAIYNAYADAMENDAPKEETVAIHQRMLKNAEEQKEADISDSEEKRVEEKYNKQLAEAKQRLQQAMWRKVFRVRIPFLPNYEQNMAN